MNAPLPATILTGDSGLAARLSREIQGEVLFDRASRGRYATDASIYQVDPLGVIVPETIADVQAAFGIAREYGIPVLPRGGGTSQCGQTTGAGLVIDHSKHLRKVLQRHPPPAPTEAAVRLVEAVGKLQNFVHRHKYGEANARLNNRDIFGRFVLEWISSSSQQLSLRCRRLEQGVAGQAGWLEFASDGGRAASGGRQAGASRAVWGCGCLGFAAGIAAAVAAASAADAAVGAAAHMWGITCAKPHTCMSRPTNRHRP